MNKRIKTLGITMLLVTSLGLVGCSSGNAKNVSNSDDANNTEATDSSENGTKVTSSDATYGEVTAIKDKKITIDLGTMKQMDKSKFNALEGTPPADMKDNDNSKDKNSMKGERPSMLDKTGKSKTITVTDSTKIMIKSMNSSKEGSISDIVIGDILAITFDEDGTTVESIEVQSFNMGGERPEGMKPQQNDSNDKSN